MARILLERDLERHCEGARNRRPPEEADRAPSEWPFFICVAMQ